MVTISFQMRRQRFRIPWLVSNTARYQIQGHLVPEPWLSLSPPFSLEDVGDHIGLSSLRVPSDGVWFLL